MRISNKLRSFFIVLLSIVVVMAALPLNALRVNADIYYIYYYGNGGKESDGSEVFSSNSDDQGKFTIKDNVLPKNSENPGFINEGFVFAGWKDDEGHTYSINQTVSPGSDLKVYAQWAAERTITFDANFPNDATGIAGEMDPQVVGQGISTQLDANSFECNEYYFTGWNTDSEGAATGTAYTDGEYITAGETDIMLFAQWAKKTDYSINFYGNPPTSTATVGGSTGPQTVYENTTPNLIKNGFECAGYRFDHWNTAQDDDNTGTKYLDGASISVTNADIELYAQWVKVWTVSFDANGGTGSQDAWTVDDGENFVVPGSTTITRDGYRLDGWFIGSPDGTPVGIGEDSPTVNADMILYAKWQQVYVITYDPNGGTGSNSQTVDVGNSVGVLDATGFARTGYAFNGWNTNADGTGTAYAPDSSIKPEGNTTLYAQWKRVVNLHSNDGTDTIVTQEIPVDTEAAIKPSTVFTAPEGMEFFGWTTTADGKVIEYAEQEKITISGTDSTDVKDLYAQWAVPVTITFDSNDSAYYGNASGTMSTLKVGKGLQFTLTANGYTLAGHNFSGWKVDSSVEGVTITKSGDNYTIEIDSGYSGTSLTLYAQWDVTEHTVSFTDWDGSSVDSSNVPYGVKPSHSALTRDDTTEHTYEFAGWENTSTGERYTGELPEVTGPVTYKAYYAEYNRQYTVSAAVSPEEAGTVTVGGSDKYSETAALTVDPAIGYHVVGWTNNTENANNDTTSYNFVVSGDHNVVVYLERDPHTVRVTTSGGGSVTGDADLVYGDSATVVASPAAGYHFVRWTDNNGTEVSTDATFAFTVTEDHYYVAVFEVNSYDISISSAGNGSVSGSGTYNHFDTCTITATPNTGYHFTGWKDPVSGEIVIGKDYSTYSFTVEGSRELIATFDINSYSISVTTEGHGTVEGNYLTIDHFKEATVKATPEEGYHFVGWVENGTLVSDKETYTFTVTGNRKLEGVFDVNMYTVTYKDDNGTILQQSEFAYGTNAYYQKTTPTKAPTAQYTYKFAGWDNKVTLVTGDVTYTAVYDKTVNQYTVTFVNADGKVLQTGLVDYGAMPTYDGETPVKAATVEYTYTFAGWDKEITKVQGDITYTATYSEKKFEKGDIDYVYFKVMFNSNGGSDVVTQLVQDGYTATIPDDPMRERYNFAGWYLDEDLTKPFSFSTPITSDITLYAKWVKGVQEVTVTYAVVGDGTVKWEAGSSEGVVITVDRSQDNDTGAEHFKSIQIDGEEVAYFNYEVSEGSATITLSTDILKDMAPGTYKVTILFDDGQAEVDLIIEGDEAPAEVATETPVPEASDDNGAVKAPNYLGLWIAIGIVALVCICAAPVLIIKRRGVK